MNFENKELCIDFFLTLQPWLLGVIFSTKLLFCGRFISDSSNMAFFGTLRANRGTFLLIYSKSAENKMSFEIHVTTIATGSLSFGLKNR